MYHLENSQISCLFDQHSTINELDVFANRTEFHYTAVPPPMKCVPFWQNCFLRLVIILQACDTTIMIILFFKFVPLYVHFFTIYHS